MNGRACLVAVVVVAVIAGCSSSSHSHAAEPQTAAKTCTGNAKNGSSTVLPMADGIAAFPEMTLISSGTAGLGGKYMPVPDCTYTPIAGLEQLWVRTSAVDRYGPDIAKVPLPLPLEFTTAHPGASEVTLSVVEFSGSAQPRALLVNPDFVVHDGWTKLPGASMHGGNTFRVDSLANDGNDEFLLQWATANKWIEVSILGAALTLDEAEAVAARIGA